MGWLRTIAPEDATGRLRRIYDAALQRAGKVYQIVRVMSLSPPVLEASMGMYREVMYARGPLPRAQRELLAVVVSRVNHCHY